MARECPPTQFVREYTKNGIEAIDAYRRLVDPAYCGKVLWTVAPETLGLPVPKLCVIDTGIGMTADELPAYVNDLTASGKTRSLHANYGVGAKVSAARYNPAGVLYFSWRDGIGSYVELGRDRHGTWGMRQHRRPDGSVEAVLPVPDELKPSELDGIDHGTMVVFLGEHAEHDTTRPPAGHEHRDRWIAKYLNRRFYRIPAWVVIRAREERANGGTSMRQVRGQAHFLDEHTQDQGVVEIPGALVHWRVLNEDTEVRRNDGSISARPVTAHHLGEKRQDRQRTLDRRQRGALLGDAQLKFARLAVGRFGARGSGVARERCDPIQVSKILAYRPHYRHRGNRNAPLRRRFRPTGLNTSKVPPRAGKNGVRRVPDARRTTGRRRPPPGWRRGPRPPTCPPARSRRPRPLPVR